MGLEFKELRQPLLPRVLPLPNRRRNFAQGKSFEIHLLTSALA